MLPTRVTAISDVGMAISPVRVEQLTLLWNSFKNDLFQFFDNVFKVFVRLDRVEQILPPFTHRSSARSTLFFAFTPQLNAS